MAPGPTGAPSGSTSGVLIHVHGPDAVWPLCFECQLKSGNAGQVVGTGLDIPDAPLISNRKRAPKFDGATETPIGQWNTYDITAQSNTLLVFVNGVRANYVDKLPAEKGAIALQLEGYPIEFRNIWLENLPSGVPPQPSEKISR